MPTTLEESHGAHFFSANNTFSVENSYGYTPFQIQFHKFQTSNVHCRLVTHSFTFTKDNPYILFISLPRHLYELLQVDRVCFFNFFPSFVPILNFPVCLYSSNGACSYFSTFPFISVVIFEWAIPGLIDTLEPPFPRLVCVSHFSRVSVYALPSRFGHCQIHRSLLIDRPNTVHFP